MVIFCHFWPAHYKKYFCSLLIISSLTILLFYTGVTTGQQALDERCYFRTTFTNHAHYSISAQCWNKSDIMPIMRHLILPADISPIVHVKQSPSLRKWSSTWGTHLVTRGNRSSTGWTVSVDEVASLSCVTIKTETLEWLNVSTTIEGKSDTRCWYDDRVHYSLCSNISADKCMELDHYSSPWIQLSLLATASSYYIAYTTDNRYINFNDLIPLPSCLPSHTNSSFNYSVLYWNPLMNVSCSGPGVIAFVPLKVYASFATGIFVVGNGIIYSPSKGDIFYSLSLPPNFIVTNFNVLEDKRQYVFLTHDSHIQDSCRMWFGIIGSEETMIIYPSTPFDVILHSFRGITLCNDSNIYWNQYNQLILETGSNVSVLVPLFSMFEEAVRNYTLGSSHSLFLSSRSSSPHHRLLNNVTGSQNFSLCPFTSAIVQSPICRRYTRTSFLVEENLIDQFDGYANSYSNCSVHANELPPVVYLSRGDSYEFAVHYFLNYFDKPSLHFSLATSSLNVVQITFNSSWSPTTNTVLVKVQLREALQPEEARQVASGETLSQTRVELKPLGSEMFCAREILWEQILVPGVFGLLVRVGCPPGLSLIYDHQESIGDQNHYCAHSDTDHCLYFYNEFYPVFVVKDLVTGSSVRYLGRYSLIAVAGGTSREDMAVFSQERIISLLWSPLDEGSNGTTFDSKRNGLRWSDQWNDLQGWRGTAEYYLHLEATNRGDNGSYCLFTVQFIVRIHGIRPSPLHSVITLLVCVAVFYTILFIGFAIWLLCKRGKNPKEISKE